MDQGVGQSPSSAGGSRCRSTFQFSRWVKVRQVGHGVGQGPSSAGGSRFSRWVKVLVKVPVQQVGHGVGQSASSGDGSRCRSESQLSRWVNVSVKVPVQQVGEREEGKGHSMMSLTVELSFSSLFYTESLPLLPSSTLKAFLFFPLLH